MKLLARWMLGLALFAGTAALAKDLRQIDVTLPAGPSLVAVVKDVQDAADGSFDTAGSGGSTVVNVDDRDLLFLLDGKSQNAAVKKASELRQYRWLPKPSEFNKIGYVTVNLLRDGDMPAQASVVLHGSWGVLSTSKLAPYTRGYRARFAAVPPGPVLVTVGYRDGKGAQALSGSSGRLSLESKAGRSFDIPIPDSPPRHILPQPPYPHDPPGDTRFWVYSDWFFVFFTVAVIAGSVIRSIRRNEPWP